MAILRYLVIDVSNGEELIVGGINTDKRRMTRKDFCDVSGVALADENELCEEAYNARRFFLSDLRVVCVGPPNNTAVRLEGGNTLTMCSTPQENLPNLFAVCESREEDAIVFRGSKDSCLLYMAFRKNENDEPCWI